MQKFRKVKEYIVVVLLAFLLAASYELFIYPNNFAPAGIPGIATIIQHLTGFSVGYMNVLVNIPLLIIVYRFSNMEYVIHTAIFSMCFSLFLILMDHMDLCNFVYHTENGTSAILGPLAGGLVSGFCYGTAMKHNGCTGGTDLVAAWLHHHRPERNIVWLIFGINTVVAAVSYFVYDFQIEPVILCLLYCFTSSKVGDIILKGFKEAIKFEIITDNPKELADAIMETFHHGVTEVPAIGGFTKQDKTMLVCLVNKHQIVRFQRLLGQFPGTFAYMTSVKETMGNFIKSK